MWPWLIVLVIVLLLFGRGKVSGLMGDVAHGMKSFRKGLADDDEAPTQQLEDASGTPAANTTDTDERTKATT
ncbi:MAG: twin-arginine translocase TatA/TatE family subunit [Alphaproteobacteria bacterium]